ncbi:hypothetical protein, partial [Burkholderia cenocepacia]
ASSFHADNNHLNNIEGTGYRGERPNKSRSISLERFVEISQPEELRSFVDKCLEARGLGVSEAY